MSVAARSESRAGPLRPVRGPASLGHDGLPFDLTGVRPFADRLLVLRTAAWNLELARQADTRVVKRWPVSATPQVRGPSSGTLSGTCAAMKPAGFPDWIVQRESRGNPTARNPSGAYGCAQIMPLHFRAGGTCAGLNYQACWARLYQSEGLRPWAG